jgi:hypothetical protein
VHSLLLLGCLLRGRGVVTLASANTVTPAYLLSNVTQNTSYTLYLVGQDAGVPPNTQARVGDFTTWLLVSDMRLTQLTPTDAGDAAVVHDARL